MKQIFTLKVLVPVLIVASIAGVSTFALLQQTTNPSQFFTATTTPTSLTAGSSQTTIPAGYKLYTVDQGDLFFQFLYPANMRYYINNVEKDFVFSMDLFPEESSQTPSEVAISVFDNSQGLDLNTWVSSHMRGSSDENTPSVIESVRTSQNISISGLTARLVADSSNGLPIVTRLLIKTTRYIISISVLDLNKGAIITPYLDIVSTLRFNPSQNLDEVTINNDIFNFIQTTNGK